MVELSQENKIIDLPDLNRFRIGDYVIVDASAENDRFEGVIIGIELRRKYSSTHLEPCITLLHDGYITDEFKPIDCRKVNPSPATKMQDTEQGLWRFWNEQARSLAAENRKLRDALEWYADEVMAYSITQANEPRSAVHGDRGARAALASEGQP